MPSLPPAHPRQPAARQKPLAKSGLIQYGLGMGISEIAGLPLREKFQIMELLWNDMRAKVDDAAAPAQHRALLDSRRKRVEDGTVALKDWDQVKSAVGQV